MRRPAKEKKRCSFVDNPYLFGWEVFSGERFTMKFFFRHGLQDGYLSSKPHVENELFPLIAPVMCLMRLCNSSCILCVY